MTFRVDDALKRDFDKLCDEFGFSGLSCNDHVAIMHYSLG